MHSRIVSSVAVVGVSVVSTCVSRVGVFVGSACGSSHAHSAVGTSGTVAVALRLHQCYRSRG